MEILQPSIFTALIIGLSLLTICFIVQLYFYFRYYNALAQASKKEKKESEVYPSLSVVICVENQIRDLKNNLKEILKQDYPNFEVIVVDIASDDGTKDFLEQIEQKYANFYYSFTPSTARFISRKKLAQTIGIKASKYDWLVFTEIECQPTSHQWLKKLARNFKKDTDIVLGYSSYQKEKSWLNRYSSYDNQLLHMRFLGLALKHKPYMGLGRNMAYRKSLFYKDKAFSNQLNLQRGEDSLFINQYASKTNTAVELSKESVVRVSPLERAKEWKLSKRFHLLSVNRFKGKMQYVVALETITRLCFHFLALVLLLISIIGQLWLFTGYIVVLGIMRWSLQFTITNKVGKAVGEERRYYFSLYVMDWLLPLKILFVKLKMPKRGRGDIIKL